ncbi:hypothetical protein SAY86_017401 [Trapa natans]|uniref:Uncharacterized protein n=1 Tax=Trapa natans TaxID=22666 RepID=A0AAN7R524_TRANT|nr:hypothetical protein SAY86_017401 [Trapa natans]
MADIRIGTWVHDIECHPGQGARLSRAAATLAKIMKESAENYKLEKSDFIQAY